MRRRVLLIAYLGDLGGGERSLLDIAGGLDPSRYESFVVCPPGGALEAELGRSGIPHEAFPMADVRKGLRFGTTIARLFRLIRREHIDVVHANSDTVNRYGLIAARLARRPVVVHLRVIRPLSHLRKLLVPWTSRIVANSSASAAPLEGTRAWGKVRVVHNWVDPAVFLAARDARDSTRASLGAKPGDLVVGLVGQVQFEEKGIGIFLDAASRALGSLPELKLVVVGGDTRGLGDADRVRARAEELGLTGRLVMAGFRHDIPNIMAALDIMALPTRHEAFGRVFVEAMAAGTPVIGSAVGGVPEVVEANITGLLVPPGEAQALADALVRLGSDQTLRRRMGEAGIRRVSERFSRDAALLRLQSVYDELFNPAR